MTQKMSSRDRELFQRCGEVLHYIWDPIGVAGIPQARDEYDSYVPQVVGRVRSSATPEEIASHLNRICFSSGASGSGRRSALDAARSRLATVST
jgi:hypothetical protein